MKVEDLGAGPAVEVAGGLVGEDDLGPAGQGPGHGDALLLAAGELARPVVQAVGEADGADDLVEPLGVGLAAGEVHREGDVLLGGEGGHQVERLEDEADPVAAQQGELLLREAAQVGVADEDLARGERVEAGDAVHQRGLAGARRAHDGGEGVGREVDGDAVEGPHLGVALAVDLRRVDGPGGDGGGAVVAAVIELSEGVVAVPGRGSAHSKHAARQGFRHTPAAASSPQVIYGRTACARGCDR